MRFGLVFLSLLLPLTAFAQDEAAPPNIVLINFDDVGWADLGSYGSQLNRTPRLDELARQGLRLDSFYVSQPVCGASRASLMTGCYANRVGISGAPDHRARWGLAQAETTIAEMLKPRGYVSAAFGKWHLGCHRPFFPTRQGFDRWAGIPYSNDMWPLHPTARGYYPPLPFYEQEDLVATNPDQSRFSRDLTERSLDFIRRHRDRPFFCYLAHPMAHVPLFAGEKFAGRSGRGLYADVIEELDHETGRILDLLAELGIAKRTLVIVTSDNGPWLSYGRHAGRVGPLREGKGTTFEGGVRVPALLRWPGRIPAGSSSEEPLMNIDILPTLAKLCGAKLPPRAIDGRDASAVLLDPARGRSPHEALFFYYRRNELQAMRSGRWKLHFPHQYRTLAPGPVARDGRPAPYRQKRTGLELYDLQRDIGESRDLAREQPEVVARLNKLADAMRRELGDQLTKTTGRSPRPPGRLPDEKKGD
jgi:arylsulfatase A